MKKKEYKKPAMQVVLLQQKSRYKGSHAGQSERNRL